MYKNTNCFHLAIPCGDLETAKKLETFANKDLKKKTEIYDNLYQYAHSLVDLSQNT